MIKKILFILFIFPVFIFIADDSINYPVIKKDYTQIFRKYVEEIYTETCLNFFISYRTLEYALTGYYILSDNYNLNKDNILTIIDYTKPSTTKRLFTVDVKNRQLLFVSLVAHGRKSGGKYAEKFSNNEKSKKSCIGFFITENAYHGLYGYSLILNGLEERFNSNARERNIVIHGSRHVSEEYIEENGILYRGWGCPIVPNNISRRFINAIKEGSCLFIYHDNKKYKNNSKYLNVERGVAKFIKENTGLALIDSIH